MIGAAAEAAGIGRIRIIPFPITEPDLWDDYVPPRRGPLPAPLLLLGELQARPPPGARATAPRCSRRPRARWSRASRCARPSGTGATGAAWCRPRSPASSTTSPPGMRSLLVLLLDGLGDRAHPDHGGRTANEAAAHPQPRRPRRARLDRPAAPRSAPAGRRRARSPTGRSSATRRPSSPAARSSRRAATATPRPPARCSPTRPCAPPSGATAPSGSPAAPVPATARTPGPCWRASRGARSAGSTLELRPLVPERGEGVLVVDGRRPRRRHRLGPLLPRPPSRCSAPGRLVPEAAATARAAELWSRATLRALARHPVNAARRRRGRPPLDAVTLKWWGRPREAPTFRARHGLDGVLIAASPFLAGPGGDAWACGSSTAPRATTRPPPCATGSRWRGRPSTRAPPSSSATSRPPTRPATPRTRPSSGARSRPSTRALEGLGDRFADAIVCVTGDHATPTSPEVIHSGDPVPFLLAGPGRARRPRRALRGARLRRGPARAPHRRGRDARAAERRRPAALPGLAPHPGARRPPGFPADVEPLRP